MGTVNMMDLNELRNCIKSVFDQEKYRQDSFLDGSDLERLLECDVTKCTKYGIDCGSDFRIINSSTMLGYPNIPLYFDIAEVLNNWMESGTCPAIYLPYFFMLNEGSYPGIRKSTFTSTNYLVEGLKELWSDWNNEEREYRIRQIFMHLGKRGLLDMISMRKTVGSCDIFPPPKYTLFESFQSQQCGGSSILTVGARALAKHFHRDKVSKYWGVSSGTESDKNINAFNKVKEILETASWINIHHLPENLIALEVRQGDGYGARWSADGLVFRGFLEPQMEDGHEIGWRH